MCSEYLQFIRFAFQSGTIHFEQVDLLITAQQCGNVLYNTNFGIDFVLYCISGQNFRKAVFSVFCRPVLKRRETAMTGKSVWCRKWSFQRCHTVSGDNRAHRRNYRSHAVYLKCIPSRFWNLSMKRAYSASVTLVTDDRERFPGGPKRPLIGCPCRLQMNLQYVGTLYSPRDRDKRNISFRCIFVDNF